MSSRETRRVKAIFFPEPFEFNTNLSLEACVGQLQSIARPNPNPFGFTHKSSTIKRIDEHLCSFDVWIVRHGRGINIRSAHITGELQQENNTGLTLVSAQARLGTYNYIWIIIATPVFFVMARDILLRDNLSPILIFLMFAGVAFLFWEMTFADRYHLNRDLHKLLKGH